MAATTTIQELVAFHAKTDEEHLQNARALDTLRHDALILFVNMGAEKMHRQLGVPNAYKNKSPTNASTNGNASVKKIKSKL